MRKRNKQMVFENEGAILKVEIRLTCKQHHELQAHEMRRALRKVAECIAAGLPDVPYVGLSPIDLKTPRVRS